MPPFRTGKPAEDKYLKVVARHLRNPAPDAMTVNPNADRELAELARLMMSKKPLERPSYADLAQRLTAILSRLDPEAVPEIVVASRDRSRPNTAPNFRPSAADDSATVSDGSMGAALSVPSRGLPGWLIAFTVLCLGVFATGLVIYLRADDGGAHADPGGGSAPVGSGSGGRMTVQPIGSAEAMHGSATVVDAGAAVAGDAAVGSATAAAASSGPAPLPATRRRPTACWSSSRRASRRSSSTPTRSRSVRSARSTPITSRPARPTPSRCRSATTRRARTSPPRAGG